MTIESIRSIVDDLVKKFQTNNPSELCKLLGIDVIETYLEDIACAMSMLGESCIILNKSLNLKTRNNAIELGHELGHIMLEHIHTDPLFIGRARLGDRLEYEADYFAVYLFLHKGENQQEYQNTEIFEKKVNYYLNRLKELRK